MNKYLPYAGIIISIALAILAVFTIMQPYAAIIVGVPLMFLEWRYSALSGFIIGLVVPFSILLSYPISSVETLSGIVGQLTGMPSGLLIIIYPLMFGIITALSALLFTGIREAVFTDRQKGKA